MSKKLFAATLSLILLIALLPSTAGATSYYDRASWEAAMNSWTNVTLPGSVGDTITAGTMIPINSDLSIFFDANATVAALPNSWPAGTGDANGLVLIFSADTITDNGFGKWVNGSWWSSLNAAPANAPAWCMQWGQMQDLNDPYAWSSLLAWGNEPVSGFGLSIGVYDVIGLMSLGDAKPEIPYVPEPSTFLLLGAGLAGLGFLRKRRV